MPDEYLEWEPQQEIKYEYVDGEVLAMTGGTIPHNDIALNIATALKAYLRGKKCKTSMAVATRETDTLPNSFNTLV